MSYQREFPRCLRLGVVGAGSHCYRNLLPALNFLPVEFAALCDLNRALAEKTAAQYGVKAVFTDAKEMFGQAGIEVAILCVGPGAHPKLAALALEAGLHVWMEKPPAMRASEVEALLPLRKDRVVMTGFKKAFMPATDKVREILSTPEFGPLYSMLGIYPTHVPANGKAILDKREFTDWLGNGCHPISMLTCVGGAVRTVTTHRPAEKGGTVVLEFESGALGTLVLSAGAPTSQSAEQYQFFGKGGSVAVEDSSRVVFKRGIPFQYGKSVSFAPEGLNHGALVWEPQNAYATLENMPLFTQGFYGCLKTFCDAVISGGKIEGRGSLEHAITVMKVYEAALLSEGGPIAIK
jgi:predicted dehydrogenase